MDAYVPERDLVEVVERYALDPEPTGQVWLRSVPEPWPFPANARVSPALVAAIDLVDGGLSHELMELGRAQLRELVDGLEPSWQRRPDRRGRSVHWFRQADTRHRFVPADQPWT